ncbi:4,4'-diaponeurosporenoate glycosyltransferase OS=Streptomyces fumanus OX=67302 GN=GCM10018772_13770 PE=3 SV=1 [Streptomyces fumanus]
MLIAANLAATVLRFLLFRAWVFPDRRDDDHGSHPRGHQHEPPRPAAPAYATPPDAPAYATPAIPPHPHGPLPRRSVEHTLRMRPVSPARPTDSDPRDPR